MAFAVTDYYSGDPKEDTQYVEWKATLQNLDNHVKSNATDLTIQRCNEADYENFFPIAQDSKNLLESMKSKNAFYCIKEFD